MAAAAGSSQKKISVSCLNIGIYEVDSRSNIFSPSIWDVSKDPVAGDIANFLLKNGLNAFAEQPPQDGVQAGGIGATAGGVIFMVKSVKIAMTVMKIVSSLQGWQEKYARRKRKEFLPNRTVRLEILEQEESLDSNDNHPHSVNLISIQHLVASIQEVSEFLQKEYPLVRFEYLLIAPKGKRDCYSIHIPDRLISNTNVMKIINKLAKEKYQTSKCTVKLEKRRWGFGSKVSLSRKSHMSSPVYKCHATTCEAPIHGYFS